MSAPPALALAALALAAVMLAGCSGDPAPAPSTPTPLSDEQAFAAAEETYRAYVDALNAVDLSDPSTFEPVYDLTTGDANANERESLSEMHADGWTVSGSTTVISFQGEQVDQSPDGLLVVAIACSDVSQVQVFDAAGVSQVDPARPAVFALRVQLSGPAESLKIESSNAIDEPSCD